MTAIEKMDAVAREIMAQEQVFTLIANAILHEDLPEADEMQVEMDELAEMDAVIGRQG